jgi:hypothetical protein
VRYYREHWYHFGGALFVALAFGMGLWGGGVPVVQRLLILSFMALLIHQFEEYALPGGFPAAYNMALCGERALPDRYPLNAQTSLVVNVFLGYPFYLAAVLLPGVIWLGLAQMLFGMAQIGVHGVLMNAKLRRGYNPGMASVVLLHFPIGILYIQAVTSQNLARPADFFIGIAATALAGLLVVALPIRALKNRDARHPFAPEEMRRFHVEDKLREKGLWDASPARNSSRKR